MILGPDVVAALIIRTIILLSAIALPIILSLGYVIYVLKKRTSLKKRFKRRFQNAAAIFVLSLTPILFFPSAANQGAYLFVYAGALAAISIFVLWFNTAKNRHIIASSGITLGLVILYNLTIITHPLIVRQEESREHDARVEYYASLADSFQVDYYLPKDADNRDFRLVYIDEYPKLNSSRSNFVDMAFLDINKIPNFNTYPKCVRFINIYGLYSKTVGSSNQWPCEHLGEINGFDVWTQEQPHANSYNLYRNDLLLVLDGRINSKEVSNYISSLRPVGPNEIAEYIW